MCRYQAQDITVPAMDVSEIGVAGADGILQHGLEYRLKIARRAADNLKHVGRSCLLLKRLRKLSRALLLRLEEAHVLDGDGGLIGERRQKSNVLLLERSHLSASDQNGAKRALFVDQRYGKGAAVPKLKR
jgi:hypothetical protein